MTKDNISMIQNILAQESFVAAYCVATNMPLVETDPETAADRIRIFASEELFREFAQTYHEIRLPLRGIRITKKDRPNFFGSLFLTGINEVAFVSSEDDASVALDRIVKRPNFSNLKPEQTPVMNPRLQLVGICYTQEASRKVPSSEKEGLSEMMEELMVNMTRARYLSPIRLQDGPETEREKLRAGKFSVPVMRLPKEQVLQPLFTDMYEFQKYANGQKLQSIAVPFAALSTLLQKESTGFLLNPAGIKLTMKREFVERGMG